MHMVGDGFRWAKVVGGFQWEDATREIVVDGGSRVLMKEKRRVRNEFNLGDQEI